MRSAKVTEVWGALSTVCDPELDEPITELEFVEEVVVAGSGDVTVRFRLPTAWCSPNFAWLMATGIVTEVSKLTWVKEVRPILRDHVFGNKINEGLTLGSSFEEVFGDEVNGSIEEVRKKFAIKAFQRRQELVIKDLLNNGLEVVDLLAMTLNDLSAYNFNSEKEIKNQLRYIEARGGFEVKNSAAFVDETGEEIHLKCFKGRMEKLRSTRLNMEFTGSVCRSLLKVRDTSEQT